MNVYFPTGIFSFRNLSKMSKHRLDISLEVAEASSNDATN